MNPVDLNRPTPAGYWLAAGLASIVIVVCFATARWTPWFVFDMGESFPELYRFGPGLLLSFSTAVGLAFAGVPWLAVRWPAVATGIAALPLVPALINGEAVHFGVFAALCAVLLTAGWRSPAGAGCAAGAAAAFVIGWLVSGREMTAPFSSTIQLDQVSAGDRVVTGIAYLLAVGLVGLVAWRLRVSGLREVERRALTARAGQVEDQAAVIAERSRLARDLHDVVAHHVSLIAVRAETAPYTNPGLGSEARDVLAEIASDARLALDELRGVLGILGRAGERAELAPQPSWHDIAALVERSRAAGAVVELRGDAPEPAVVSPATGYAAYRLVQEALTNARKHAPSSPVEVTLTSTGAIVVVRIASTLAGEVRAGGPGHGLIGMRERVEALGGRLVAGPVGGEFVVEATLPQGPA